jgi:hypothetical protein
MNFIKLKFAADNDSSSGGPGASSPGSGSSQSSASQARDIGQKIVGDIFKKAVTMGASAVERAESTVNKTLALNPANLSKEMIKEVLESFFENYTIQVNAEIKLNPRKKAEEKMKE